MQQTFSATTEATPQELFDVVSDIRTYPEWLDLVSQVDPDSGSVDEANDEPEAWLVTLKAKVGPFSRSKRLRMVRSVHEPAGAQAGGEAVVRFERHEVDGKDHSAWLLSARVGAPDPADPQTGSADKSAVWLDLDYDGALWSGILDGVLGAAADRAAAKLKKYAEG